MNTNDEHIRGEYIKLSTIVQARNAMLYWALQFATAVRVTAPQSLVERIKTTLDGMQTIYANLN